MKKISVLLSLTILALFSDAQFVNQLVYLRSFTPQQIDSIFVGQGIPSGVFPINYGAKAYKIVYNTVDGDSLPTIASGLFVVPENPPCKVGLISYQHGTTLEKNQVPSRLKSEWFISLAVAANGLDCVMPDYLGLGSSPGMHPYQHAHSEATAVVDMIRAAKEVADSLGAPMNDQLFLFGYSQGGHATMAAHQLIQEQFDSVMHVTASAPMSGAYDMSGVMVNVMLSDSTYPEPYYLPYLLLGFNSVYHFYNNVSDVLVSPYDTLLPPLFDGHHSGGDVDQVMPSVPKLILKQSMIDSFKNDSMHFFRVALRENDTYNWTPNSPLKMYYCMADKSVDYHNSIVAYQHFIQNGATQVDTVDVNPNLDHYPCAQFAILGGVTWLKTFAYQPLSGTVSATNVSSANAADGTATATGVNGNPHYTYLWNNNDTTSSIAGLTAGTYYVTITDGNNCTHFDSVVVQTATGISDFTMNNLRVYPNPAHKVIHIEWNEPGDHISSVELLDMSGRRITSYLIPKVTDQELWFDESLAKGLYYLHIKTETGKSANRQVMIE